jgi:hypothetical protein
MHHAVDIYVYQRSTYVTMMIPYVDMNLNKNFFLLVFYIAFKGIICEWAFLKECFTSHDFYADWLFTW